MYHNLPIPTVFAHRGASAYAPENTLAAFKLAIEQGADALEMDAKLTADGHIILFYDQSLERIIGHKRNVGARNLAELRSLDAGAYFDNQFQGERIPTLEQVFDTIGEGCFYNLELTNYATLFDDLPGRVVRKVCDYRLEGHILFSSFNPIALVRTMQLLPDAPIALLAQGGEEGLGPDRL